MTRAEYAEIENFMLIQMQESAHDKHHIYRVLNFAMDIYSHEKPVDFDVLVAACLLHDIGREKQSEDVENRCHAEIGGDMAYDFLISRKWTTQKAAHAKECIASHRYRKGNPPNSIEAKILYDADKLEASGALGIARSLIYAGQVAEPLYIMDDDGNIIVDHGGAEISSFIQEYNYKLKKVYDSFYTNRAKEIAFARQKTAMDFYEGLLAEISGNYENGMKSHMSLLEESTREE